MVITPDPELEAALTVAAEELGIEPAELVLSVLRQQFLTNSPPAASSVRVRTLGLHSGAMVIARDFDAPLPDDFWAGQP
jgi:hypothetical protein